MLTLRSRIAGTVIERGAPDYPRVRDAMLWNELKPQRSPELIVRVKSAGDVAAAIDFALPISPCSPSISRRLTAAIAAFPDHLARPAAAS